MKDGGWRMDLQVILHGLHVMVCRPLDLLDVLKLGCKGDANVCVCKCVCVYANVSFLPADNIKYVRDVRALMVPSLQLSIMG